MKLPSLVNGPAKYSHVELPKLYHHMLIMPSQFYEVIIINPPTFLLRNFPDIAQIHSRQSVVTYFILWCCPLTVVQFCHI